MLPENEKRFKERMGYKVEKIREVWLDQAVEINERLSKILGWSRIYHGFDGRPMRLIGFTEYNLGLGLIFEHNAGEKRIKSIQIIEEGEVTDLGEWFLWHDLNQKDHESLILMGIYF